MSEAATYDQEHDYFYRTRWNHNADASFDQLLLTSYPYSIELPLRNGSRWLEIGVGTGRVVDYWLRKGIDFKCTGIEISEKGVELAKRLLPNEVDIQQGDVRTLQYPEGSFDLITLFGTLQTFPRNEWISRVKEMMKWLTPGGSLGFSLHPLNLHEIALGALDPLSLRSALPNFITKGQLVRELHRHGLKNFSIERHFNYRFPQLFLKLFGVQTQKWFGMDEFSTTAAAKLVTKLWERALPAFTFGHHWICVRRDI